MHRHRGGGDHAGRRLGRVELGMTWVGRRSGSASWEFWILYTEVWNKKVSKGIMIIIIIIIVIIIMYMQTGSVARRTTYIVQSFRVLHHMYIHIKNHMFIHMDIHMYIHMKSISISTYPQCETSRNAP